MIKGISNALFSIFSEGKYADKVVPALLKANPSWGSRDRRFVAENVYDLVRYWRRYWHLLNETPNTDAEAINRLVAFKLHCDGFEIPGWKNFPTPIEGNNAAIEIKESFPDWIHQRALKQLGDRWLTEAKALNQPASVFLRVNLSRITITKAIREFKESGINVDLYPEISGCLILSERKSIERHKLLTNGLVEIQDAGSQLIAPFLAPSPGSLIVDACAGAGGKSLHLADLTGDKSKIISADVEHWKLNNLLFRANKSRFNSITTLPLPDEYFFKNNTRKIDFLLLDAPCSGLGVIKRNPDTKWKLTENHLEALKETQQHILTEYSASVKPGGRMVYATCSILPEENEDQVNRFLTNHPNAKLIKQHHQWPSMGTDGFFMALIEL